MNCCQPCYIKNCYSCCPKVKPICPTKCFNYEASCQKKYCCRPPDYRNPCYDKYNKPCIDNSCPPPPPCFSYCSCKTSPYNPCNPCNNGYNPCNPCNPCNNGYKYPPIVDPCSNDDFKFKSCCKVKNHKKCLKAYPCLRTDCGFFKFELNVTTNTSTYSTLNQPIIFSYTIKNVGSLPIAYPIYVYDNLTGNYTAPLSYINQCDGTLVFERIHSINQHDLSQASISNEIFVYIAIGKYKWLCVEPVSFTFTNTNA